MPLVVSLGWSPRSRGAALGAAAALSPAARSGTERIAEPGLNPFSPRCERGEGAGPMHIQVNSIAPNPGTPALFHTQSCTCTLQEEASSTRMC